MKKQCTLFILLVCFCCLFVAGCSEKVENKNISLTINEQQKQGIYTGDIDKDIPNGEGEFKYKTQQDLDCVLKGEFKDGMLQSGTSTITIPDGKKQVFEGSFKNNVPLKGTVKTDNKISYEGEFISGIPNGQGKIYNQDGSVKYEGNIENGIPALDTVGLNQNVDFAQWNYNVTKTELQPTIGNKLASGIYLIIYLNATNNANTQRQIGANQFFVLYDNKGRIYTMDETAMFQANMIDNFQLPWYLTQIQPSLSAQNIKIIFDVPKDAKQIKLIPREGTGKANPILVIDEIK